MGLSKHGSLAWFFRRTISPPIGGNIMQRQRVLTMGVVRKHVRNSFFISLISTLVLRHPRKSASKLVTLVPKVADTKTRARTHTHTHTPLSFSPPLSPPFLFSFLFLLSLPTPLFLPPGGSSGSLAGESLGKPLLPQVAAKRQGQKNHHHHFLVL